MSFYQYHVFFCTNQREPGKGCCANFNSKHWRDYVKERTKQLGIHKPGGVRINTAGCMGRCEQGPTMVIYPEGVWYTYVDQQDLDEIINEHLLQGRIVSRLRI